MSDYIYNNGELYHYGVKGMKWGHRKKDSYAARRVRGHAGPGLYVGNKRKIEGYKRDLQRLDNGEHLSIGIGKKRQAAYDARDRKALEKGIAKAEAKEAKKAEKKQFKQDLKEFRSATKNPYADLYDPSGIYIGRVDTVTYTSNKIRTEKGEEYCNRIIEASNRRTRAYNTAVLTVGAAYVAAAVYGSI